VLLLFHLRSVCKLCNLSQITRQCFHRLLISFPTSPLKSIGLLDGSNQRVMAVTSQMNYPGAEGDIEWILLDFQNNTIFGYGKAEVGQNHCCWTPMPNYFHWPGIFWKSQSRISSPDDFDCGGNIPVQCWNGTLDFGVGPSTSPLCLNQAKYTNNGPVCFLGTGVVQVTGWSSKQPDPSFFPYSMQNCPQQCQNAEYLSKHLGVFRRSFA